MRPELEERLKNDFPTLFKLDCSCDIGNGWEPLLRRLCADIQHENGLSFTQIKEKFGGLRVYTTAASDKVHKRVEEAAEESFTTCEKCGEDGHLAETLSGWTFVMCQECLDFKIANGQMCRWTPKISPRLFKFCPKFDELTLTERIDLCDQCGRFFAMCCHHPEIVCHYHCFVFVDGACSGNGMPGARAGIGCAIGLREEDQLSLPVTDDMDSGAPRTSQRAELLAAMRGLQFVINAQREYHVGSRAHLKSKDTECEYVVVADSEYVVKGLTEWLPKWKSNRWRNAQGRTPENLDLFRELDDMVSVYESRGLKIQFLHVERKLNSVADDLARAAARRSVST
ncbi:ribonuclease H-like domain-containing protein [Mycena galericulata]|nr:ribonuclease H-like domain-containing protein [Mycena galericulata]